VQLAAGANLANAISSYPGGTTFCLASGTYQVGSSLTPKAGQRFLGQPGALLTGANTTAHAFTGAANDVVLRGLIIEHFASPLQTAAIQAIGGDRWLVEGNEVRYNAAGGIRLGDYSTARGNNVHHNHQIGVTAQGVDIRFISNEIAYNNWLDEYSTGWEAGGSKFWKTTNLLLQDNWVHHNTGTGLWTDHGNRFSTIEDNLVEDNSSWGIFHEISCEATIRNNVVRRNGFARDGTYMKGAGIRVSSSGHVEIYGNTLTANKHAISLAQDNRESTDACGASVTEDVHVYANVIVNSGESGMVQSIGDTSTFGRNITFEDNDYRYTSTSGSWWQWLNAARSWTAWRSYGHDETGSLLAS